MALLMEFGPWLLALLGGVAALFANMARKADKASAAQQVAEARKVAADTNAAAAANAVTAAQERTNVENSVAAGAPGAAADQLRDRWSRD